MDYLNIILGILVGLAKFIGSLLLGLGIGWLSLDAYRKNQTPWQVQAVFVLGLFALLITTAIHVHSALGGLGLGIGLAIIIWGLQKPKKKED